LLYFWQFGVTNTVDEQRFLLPGNWIIGPGLATEPSDRACQSMDTTSHQLSFPDNRDDLLYNRQITCRILILSILSHAVVGGNLLVRNKLFPNWQPRRLRETEFGCQSHFLPIIISALAHAAMHYGGFASGKLDSSAGVGLCWGLRPGLRAALRASVRRHRRIFVHCPAGSGLAPQINLPRRRGAARPTGVSSAWGPNSKYSRLGKEDVASGKWPEGETRLGTFHYVPDLKGSVLFEFISCIPREHATGSPRPNSSLWPLKLPWPPGHRGRAHPRSTSPGRVKRTVLRTACRCS
jgi:hypothetical protein